MMSYPAQTYSFEDMGAVGPGEALDLTARSGINGATVFIFGTFVGLLSIEVSPDVFPAGDNWLVAMDVEGKRLSNLMSPDLRIIRGDALQIRCNVKTYTSGTLLTRLVFPVGHRWSEPA